MNFIGLVAAILVAVLTALSGAGASNPGGATPAGQGLGQVLAPQSTPTQPTDLATPSTQQLGGQVTTSLQPGPGDSTTTPQSEGTPTSAPVGDHKALIDQALSLAGVPVTPANESAVDTIVQHESAWDPNAINRTDSNAAAGDPSRGLMQTIGATFRENALPGYDTNIYDPLSNLIAGIRYAVKRYGSLQNVPGVLSLASGGPYKPY
ncbi:MAG: transglycosylase SLT domain-containing protein [Candidatus Riflebacteria bacterium]|nr:transglycosylase SLT domain-containing protein [Candidatus Riflebacteria bacterium]